MPPKVKGPFFKKPVDLKDAATRKLQAMNTPVPGKKKTLGK